MDKSIKSANLYLATLKALSIIDTHSHWTMKGKLFYENHLLFERIYNSSLEDLDRAAEKMVGIFGDECLDYDLQVDLLHKVLLKYKNLDGSPVQMSLAIETDFIKLSKEVYEIFEDEGTLTLGLDDMIMSISNSREGAVYLLQRSLLDTKE